MSDGEPPSGPDPQTTTGDELTHIDVHFPDNVRFPVDTHSRTIYDSPRPDFPEWSFKNHQAVADARKELRHYLCEKYGVVTILFCEPFLVLGCDGCLPSPDARPFSVAGQIAIWRDASDMNFIARVGTSGFASAFEGDKNDDGFADDELMVRFPPAIQAKVRPHEVPHRDIILHVASLFPDCSAVTWIWGAFVVELEVRTPEEFTQHLSTLPVGIHGSGFELVFYNGPLPNAAARLRAVKPKPHLDVPRRIAGETNYVKTDGKFYPGSMLCSVTKARETYSAVSAGVPVEKDGEQRLTCSYHNWEDHHKNYPDKLGRDDRSARRIFQVVQGENGTTVGVVGERIGETDIALAELEQGVKFENKFMNLSGSPRLFTRSRDITLVDDFLFDSFTTGRQIVKGVGARFCIGRAPGTSHPHLAV